MISNFFFECLYYKFILKRFCSKLFVFYLGFFCSVFFVFLELNPFMQASCYKTIIIVPHDVRQLPSIEALLATVAPDIKFEYINTENIQKNLEISLNKDIKFSDVARIIVGSNHNIIKILSNNSRVKQLVSINNPGELNAILQIAVYLFGISIISSTLLWHLNVRTMLKSQIENFVIASFPNNIVHKVINAYLKRMDIFLLILCAPSFFIILWLLFWLIVYA